MRDFLKTQKGIMVAVFVVAIIVLASANGAMK
jgi:hypothetical protein